MTNFEMVEQLREKANVSYEEAKAALEASNWDLLDAMVLLEQEGRIHEQGASAYSTKPEEPKADTERNNRFVEVLGRLGRALAWVIKKGNDNALEIARKEQVILSIPVTAVVLLLIFLFIPTLIALVLGLFCGLRYAFRGPDLGRDAINKAMDKASDMAENIKQDCKKDKE